MALLKKLRFCLVLALPFHLLAQNWPEWRGPLATGYAPDANPPIRWDETTNVAWKTELAGEGHSSPIIWGELLFITAAEPFGEAFSGSTRRAPGAHDNREVTHAFSFRVQAYHRGNGKLVWQRTVHQGIPQEAGHLTASLASASPVTDGKHIVASFGSNGIYCLDPAGQVIWKQDLGEYRSKHGHGEGSSPTLHGKWLIVNWDHEGPSFLQVMNVRTGELRWRVDRQEVTSWASPIVVRHDGLDLIIVCGTDRLRAYNLENGSVVWECGGLSANVVATPVAADGRVYVGSSYDTRALMAIQLSGSRGDITATKQVLWTRNQGTPYVPSLLLVDDALYYLAHYQNVMTRVEAASGFEKPGPFRLPGIRNVYASPVAAADRIYVTGQNGTTVVFSHADQPQVLAINALDDRFSASAAIADKSLYLRGHRYLYALTARND